MHPAQNLNEPLKKAKLWNKPDNKVSHTHYWEPCQAEPRSNSCLTMAQEWLENKFTAILHGSGLGMSGNGGW